MRYHYQEGVIKPFIKEHTRIFTASIAVIFAFLWFAVLFGNAGASSHVVISGDTFDGSSGWVFGSAAPFDTPFEFNDDESSIGDGALSVGPVEADAPDKFIASHVFDGLDAADFNGFSYDFLIGSDASDANEFYLNVYTVLPAPVTHSFYNCRFDYVPTTGSTTAFETFAVSASDSATFVADRAGDGFTCPTSIDGLPGGSLVTFVSMNVGDTSTNDVGVSGYFDNVVADLAAGVTTFDFEPIDYVENKEECKKGGWEKGIEGREFRNQGDCVSHFASGGRR